MLTREVHDSFQRGRAGLQFLDPMAELPIQADGLDLFLQKKLYYGTALDAAIWRWKKKQAYPMSKQSSMSVRSFPGPPFSMVQQGKGRHCRAARTPAFPDTCLRNNCPGVGWVIESSVLTVLCSLPIHLTVVCAETTSGCWLFTWLSSWLGTRRHSVTVG